jgi:hypothetical protein|tara:strand:- start:1055 stop:1231 length:177 start_codon:yes stop_codon:yes gene_type:complete
MRARVEDQSRPLVRHRARRASSDDARATRVRDAPVASLDAVVVRATLPSRAFANARAR